MREDMALIGNDRIVGRVRENGVLEDAFFPSIGVHRHVLRSQFGVYLEQRRRMAWLAEDWEHSQDSVESASVCETVFRRPGGLEARLLDFVPPAPDVFVRFLEVRNLRRFPQSVAIVHAEAAALQESAGGFGSHAVYVNRQGRVLRYRGRPFHHRHEAPCCVLIGADPPPEEFQAGRSFALYGEDVDAFHDAADGRLQGNSLCGGENDGATSAFLWRGTIPPGGRLQTRVILAGGAHPREAEDRLKAAEARHMEEMLDETRRKQRRTVAAPAAVGASRG
jgi:hypothetical protein